MEDPYETGEGSETWNTKVCPASAVWECAMPMYYQRALPSSPASSRAGTPSPTDADEKSRRRRSSVDSVYVLPSPPLKRWLREQTRLHSSELTDIMFEDQYRRLFTVRSSHWSIQFAECSLSSPSMKDVASALSASFTLPRGTLVVMMYMSDIRSPAMFVENCMVSPDGELGHVEFRGSLVRFILRAVEDKGMRVKHLVEDSNPYVSSRVDKSIECMSQLQSITERRRATLWVSIVLEPTPLGDLMDLRVLVHSIHTN
ncbi:hypothetical protein BJX65DRAFT_291231 [Aspergillus insuetus]